MTSITWMEQALQSVFEEHAPRLAREHGLRKRVFSATTLAYVLVLGWLQNPRAGSSALARFAGTLGLRVQKQHVEAHFTARTSQWLVALLQQAVSVLVSGNTALSPALLARFAAVWIEDSSSISLPAALAHVWPGCGGTGSHGEHTKTEAGLKLAVRWNLRAGTLQGPMLCSARTHDRHTPLRETAMEAGSLWIADLGYFALNWLAQLSQQGIQVLIRLKDPITLWREGKRVEVLDILPQAGQAAVDEWVVLGAKAKQPFRLLAWRVPDEVVKQRQQRIRETARKKQKKVQPRTLQLAQWTILITSVPAEQLSLVEAQALQRARWQIELLFKLWKEDGLLDEWSSSKPQRVLCEVYSKLLAMLVQHWLVLLSCWDEPHRSLKAVAEVIRSQVSVLVHGLMRRLPLSLALSLLLESVQGQCRIDPHGQRLSTSRLLQGRGGWP